MKDGLNPEEVIAMGINFHKETILEISQKASSKENAVQCLRSYYLAMANALAAQSETNERGFTDFNKAREKTKKNMAILEG